VLSHLLSQCRHRKQSSLCWAGHHLQAAGDLHCGDAEDLGTFLRGSACHCAGCCHARYAASCCLLIRGTHITSVADSGPLQVISREDGVSSQPGVIPPRSQYSRGMAHDRYLLPRCGSVTATSAKAGRSRGCAGFPESIGHGRTHMGLLARSHVLNGVVGMLVKVGGHAGLLSS